MLYLVMKIQALKPDLKHLLGLHLKRSFKYVKLLKGKTKRNYQIKWHIRLKKKNLPRKKIIPIYICLQFRMKIICF